MNITAELKKVAEYYGYEAQSNQLVEECAELIQAVSKYRRVSIDGPDTAGLASKQQRALDNLVEELADVEIMIEQVKYLLQIPEEDIKATKLFKVNRIKERIAEENLRRE